jgi:hypothetical protein
MTMRERRGMTSREIKDSSERLRIDMIGPTAEVSVRSSHPGIRYLGGLVDNWIADAPQFGSDPKMIIGQRLLDDIYDLRARHSSEEDQKVLKDMERRLSKVLSMTRPKNAESVRLSSDRSRDAHTQRQEFLDGIEKKVNKWLANPPLYLKDDAMVEGKGYYHTMDDRVLRWPEGDQKDRLKELSRKLNAELNKARLMDKDASSRGVYGV